MSVECGECERDLRGGHDRSCSRWRPEQELCICDPEWQHDCPIHGWEQYRVAAGGVEGTDPKDET